MGNLICKFKQSNKIYRHIEVLSEKFSTNRSYNYAWRKLAVKKVIRQFICQHDYFNKVWQNLRKAEQGKILDMATSGKGVIPYEKITTFNNLESVL